MKARPTASTEAADFRVLQQAAEWFALLGSPAASPSDRRNWLAWCDADPRHRAAWQRVEAISGVFTSLPASDRSSARLALDEAGRRQASRRRAARLLVLVAGAAGLAWLTPSGSMRLPWQPAHRTGTGERRELALADGGRVWLNSASALDIDYGPAERRLRLHRGEILVQTAGDDQVPLRPFTVETDQGSLLARGTRFSVRQQAASTLVNVFDGAVDLQPRRADARSRRVVAGQQCLMTVDSTTLPQAADNARQGWSQGLLLAENARLGDVIADLAQHRNGYLGCSPEVANLRLVAAFELDDTDRALAALEATLPVRVRRVLPWWTVVEARLPGRG